MRMTRALTLGEQSITVKELTLGEIRAWLAENEREGGRDVVDALLLEDCPLDDLRRFCDCTPEQMNAMTQSELGELLAAAKDLNEYFFGMRSNLRLLIASTVKSSSSAPLQA